MPYTCLIACVANNRSILHVYRSLLHVYRSLLHVYRSLLHVHALYVSYCMRCVKSNQPLMMPTDRVVRARSRQQPAVSRDACVCIRVRVHMFALLAGLSMPIRMPYLYTQAVCICGPIHASYVCHACM